MTGWVSPQLRRRIVQRGGYRCSYRLTPQGLSGARLELDHIIPRTAGGQTIEENLCLACVSCNRCKGTQTHARDPETGRRVRLFNPREQPWKRHFTWGTNGREIIGITPCGRATVQALRLNHAEIILARRRWASVGWWPPLE
ncbi:MAG TPA: HNH endonuclease [Candidatus Fraserbacteria bacterium]|nr:HNH endonuclease [Candidatus Fraserbacteria bacterium]